MSNFDLKARSLEKNHFFYNESENKFQKKCFQLFKNIFLLIKSINQLINLKTRSFKTSHNSFNLFHKQVLGRYFSKFLISVNLILFGVYIALITECSKGVHH